MTAPSVTVIIPTYDRPEMAERAVRSALAQEPRPAVVLVDDGGPYAQTAGTLALEASGDITIAREGNHGTAGARNVGARFAQTEFINFLDDDDVLLPGALAGLEAALRAAPEASIAAGGGHRRYADGRIAETEWPPERRWDFEGLLDGNPFFTAAVLVRRSAFVAAGGFAVDVPLAEDWDLWLRLTKAAPARLTRVEAVEYNVHGNNQSSSGRVAGMATWLVAHYLKHFSSAERAAYGPRLVTYLIDMYAVDLSWHVRTNLRRGKFKPAIRDLGHLMRMIRTGLRFEVGRAALRRAIQGHLAVK